MDSLGDAVLLLKQSRFTTAFTGAGISVESGIPPFRGQGGLWDKYDPQVLDLQYFLDCPADSWAVIHELFYDVFRNAKPNRAHQVLARMEQEGLLGCTITQNIDNLHQEAGSHEVYELHGNTRSLRCITCRRVWRAADINLLPFPPKCGECGGLLKPDFIFFGKAMPRETMSAAVEAASISDVFLIIGTTGEVMPANLIPALAKENGARIIEVNPQPSKYTNELTDIFLEGKATEILGQIEDLLFSASLNDNQDGID